MDWLQSLFFKLSGETQLLVAIVILYLVSVFLLVTTVYGTYRLIKAVGAMLWFVVLKVKQQGKS